MSKVKSDEILDLVEETLKNIELDEILLSNICLKVARITRLMGDIEKVELFTKYSNSIGQNEARKKALQQFIDSSQDPDISITSANPNQYLHAPQGNANDRAQAVKLIIENEDKINSKKSEIYKYLINIFYELKFSEIPYKIFEKTKLQVDKQLPELLPEAVKKFVSVYDNLISENPEDWSNAVHSCRRILQDLADKFYPPNPDGKSEITKGSKKIKVGAENYINRLILFIESKTDSERYLEIVGSHLDFIGNRIDSIYDASNKGTHTVIQSKDEAERYIIYTYLLIGDILALIK